MKRKQKEKRCSCREEGGGKKKGAYLIASSSPPAPATPHLFTAGLRHFTEKKKDLTNENVRKMKRKKNVLSRLQRPTHQVGKKKEELNAREHPNNNKNNKDVENSKKTSILCMCACV